MSTQVASSREISSIERRKKEEEEEEAEREGVQEAVKKDKKKIRKKRNCVDLDMFKFIFSYSAT